MRSMSQHKPKLQSEPSNRDLRGKLPPSSETTRLRTEAAHNIVREPVISGYVDKQSNDILQRWLSRFFVIQTHFLKYYDKDPQDPDGDNPVKGYLDLTHLQDGRCARDGRCVIVSEEKNDGTEGPQISFRCSTERIAQDWEKRINETWQSFNTHYLVNLGKYGTDSRRAESILGIKYVWMQSKAQVSGNTAHMNGFDVTGSWAQGTFYEGKSNKLEELCGRLGENLSNFNFQSTAQNFYEYSTYPMTQTIQFRHGPVPVFKDEPTQVIYGQLVAVRRSNGKFYLGRIESNSNGRGVQEWDHDDVSKWLEQMRLNKVPSIVAALEGRTGKVLLTSHATMTLSEADLRQLEEALHKSFLVELESADGISESIGFATLDRRSAGLLSVIQQPKLSAYGKCFSLPNVSVESPVSDRQHRVNVGEHGISSRGILSIFGVQYQWMRSSSGSFTTEPQSAAQAGGVDVTGSWAQGTFYEGISNKLEELCGRLGENLENMGFKNGAGDSSEYMYSTYPMTQTIQFRHGPVPVFKDEPTQVIYGQLVAVRRSNGKFYLGRIESNSNGRGVQEWDHDDVSKWLEQMRLNKVPSIVAALEGRTGRVLLQFKTLQLQEADMRQLEPAVTKCFCTELKALRAVSDSRWASTVKERSVRAGSVAAHKVMLSGRFDGKHKEGVLRGVGEYLKQEIGPDNVLVVEVGAGGEFGSQMRQCMVQMTVMVAFCFEDYGQKTDSVYSSFYEVEFASQNHVPIIPLKLYDGSWPPAPEGDKDGTNQNLFVFKRSVVYQPFAPPFDDGKMEEIASSIVHAIALLPTPTPDDGLSKSVAGISSGGGLGRFQTAPQWESTSNPKNRLSKVDESDNSGGGIDGGAGSWPGRKTRRNMRNSS